MIELSQIRLVLSLDGHVLPSDEEIISYRDRINTFVYPLGLIPLSVLINSIHYKQYTFQQNIKYFQSFLSVLYQDIYSKKEIEIISVFLTLTCHQKTELDTEIIELLAPFINIMSEKEEIRYCLEEIKYNYLVNIFQKDPYNPIVSTLINELSLIEDRHNSFQLQRRTIS